MSHPYQSLPARAYWKTGVAEVNPLQISGLWQPKLKVSPGQPIITAGSCFAQHIGRALAARGFDWFDAEPAPAWLFDEAETFNYGIFSFRTGNIYTARALLQWLRMAYGEMEPPEEWWHRKGRVYDPLRPAIEPRGFESVEEARASRAATLVAIRRAVETARLFVFTLGLTESWANAETGLEYALCPGTLAGDFDPALHVFRNHRHAAILADMEAVLALLAARNPGLEVLLTVSPVPLTATASGEHVLTATSRSKATLRAVAGELVEDHPQVDYFPSYEIITHPVFRGMFYAPNQRSVVPEGVEVVMRNFFADQEAAFGPPKFPKARKGQGARVRPAAGDVKCEEEMLNAFAR
ncbi:GSCFA family protein [Pseudooceanicola antarcticus]|uniref:GSCFA family protein n=1 Tax=Pseudooceanicola antarcticus TaxID=1247613 RepID=A0A285IQ40_9RHOB|nr:GSCFA domain-containing protein [Pseudooceanicola antarcticus]PJE31659.1 GSCFA family protein [Pseudooceanicola antarcticus]SNY50140.1 GSCFA family protein [Pseudooceanicola antarcticus]